MNKTTLALLSIGLALAGCNGYDNGGNPPGYGTVCTPPANTVLVYPKNGATAVADNTMTVYIAVPSALSNAGNLDLNLIGPPSYGQQLTNGFTSVSYASIPTPNTVPGYANPQYYASTLTFGLTAASTFNVHWNNPNSACDSTTSASFLGSFTTQ
jgi:hypothetical protein